MKSKTEPLIIDAPDEVLELAPTKGKTGGAPPTNRGTTAGASAGTEGALERFSDLPMVVILAVLWVMGATLLGSGALVLYSAVRVLWWGW